MRRSNGWIFSVLLFNESVEVVVSRLISWGVLWSGIRYMRQVDGVGLNVKRRRTSGLGAFVSGSRAFDVREIVNPTLAAR